MSEPTPKLVTLVAPDGQRFTGPESGATTLRQKGFRDLNEHETKDVALQKKFGEGILPPIAAAASGAASALTFGASDFVARGLAPELADASRELAERNPNAHTAGEVGALAVPFLGELGLASGTARAAKAAGAGITGVSKGAQAVGGVARSAAEAIGAKGAAPIVGALAQGAAEGAAFQVGHNIGEASRRDAKLDAETLLAHVGEAAYMSGGLGAALPVAGKVAKWSADKASEGLWAGVEGLRRAGIAGANLGLDAFEAGAGAVARHADDIGGAVAGVAKGGARLVDKGADAIAAHADDIGGVVAGASNKVGALADDVLLPKIREGLTAQTGRKDIIDDVFAATPEARALRRELGPQTITGTREVQAEELGKSLGQIWDQSLKNTPMFDDIALAVKKELQASELAGSTMSKAQQAAAVKQIIDEANTTIDQLTKYSPTAKTYFEDALKDFAKTALSKRSPQAIYQGLDGLKVATDKIAKWSKGASLGDTGAAFAADEARRFRTFAKGFLEDTTVWGAAGQVQQEVNAAYSKYRNAFAQFEKQFAAGKAQGQAARVLDGAKIKKWAKEITGQPGELRNVVIDDLVEAQTELIALTEKLAKGSKTQTREALGEGLQSAQNLAATKSSATAAIDRAEVLQQTQSAILSRQGAGVNPLPVAIAQRIGSGALVGGAIGGIPGAIVGGGITSVLEKYGAITSNPKSAIEFLNTIDRLRGVERETVASWIKATMGETADHGIRGMANKLAAGVDADKIAGAVRRGAERAQGAVPGARAALNEANELTAQRLLDARSASKGGIKAIATRADDAIPGSLRRLLPAVSYSNAVNSSPQEWWARTQKQLTETQADPQRMADKIDRELGGISETLPTIASAIADQQMRVTGYLVDKMPRNPRPYMLGQQWTPTDGELKAFRDVVMVATKPDALLPLISAGLATRAQTDAVRALWPKKFEEMQGQVRNAVVTAASDGKPVPYESRIRLGQLLGIPLDPSQEPGFAQWMQAPRAQEKEQAPTVRGSLNLNTDGGLPMSARTAQRK